MKRRTVFYHQAKKGAQEKRGVFGTTLVAIQREKKEGERRFKSPGVGSDDQSNDITRKQWWTAGEHG